MSLTQAKICRGRSEQPVHDALPWEQTGYRWSSLDNPSILHEVAAARTSREQTLWVIPADLERAFEQVDREDLLGQLYPSARIEQTRLYQCV